MSHTFESSFITRAAIHGHNPDTVAGSLTHLRLFITDVVQQLLAEIGLVVEGSLENIAKAGG